MSSYGIPFFSSWNNIVFKTSQIHNLVGVQYKVFWSSQLISTARNRLIFYLLINLKLIDRFFQNLWGHSCNFVLLSVHLEHSFLSLIFENAENDVFYLIQILHRTFKV